MTKDLIYRVYNYDTHIDSTKENAISTTTLIGPAYKAKLYLKKTEKDTSFVDNILKRSSTLGTAFHERAEAALKHDPNIVQEIYKEREVVVDRMFYTISGSCDLLQQEEDGTYTIADWKTHYGASFKGLETAQKQLSIYRWLLQDEYNINDLGYVLSLSVTNNGKEEAHPLHLMSLEDTQLYIETRLEIITESEEIDCANTSYNSCSYCEFVCMHRQ